jgi:succinyl-diaminopimelate desuccinylase
MSKTLALTEQLIALDSVTPEDKGCQQTLISLLEPLGFRCESMPSGDVTNLWARRGTEQPLVVFAGHTDGADRPGCAMAVGTVCTNPP